MNHSMTWEVIIFIQYSFTMVQWDTLGGILFLPVKINLVDIYFYSCGSVLLCLCLLFSQFVAISLAACGSYWLGVARNTGAVIWTAGRSISKGPRRCEIWDTFHSTLPSFWQKEKDGAAQPGKENRQKGNYLYQTEIVYLFRKRQSWIVCPVIDSFLLTGLNWLE